MIISIREQIGTVARNQRRPKSIWAKVSNNNRQKTLVEVIYMLSTSSCNIEHVLDQEIRGSHNKVKDEFTECARDAFLD